MFGICAGKKMTNDLRKKIKKKKEISNKLTVLKMNKEIKQKQSETVNQYILVFTFCDHSVTHE